MKRVVIVGASVAGLTAAETLRDEGFQGEIVLVDGELHAGYDRPPLSKAILSGRMQASEIALRPAEFHRLRSIDRRLGVQARALSLSGRAVLLDSGEYLAFDGLIIATGLRARPLPGQPQLAGVHLLRTLDDAHGLRASLLASSSVVVVGGGFLGSEVAATARELVLFLRRPAGQPQLSISLASQASDMASIRELQIWMAEHLDTRLTIDRLARRMAMSVRQFERVFAREVGTTPSQYVLQLRVEAARRLLERTEDGLKGIAARSGFGSVDVMRRAFVRLLGLTPRKYRELARRPAWS